MLRRTRSLLGAVAVAALGLVAAAGDAPAAPPERNLVFVVIDTLRADGLGVYGQPLPTSPNLDAFARTAVVYENAWTQYTWTLPSYVSYMGSRFVRSHGWDYKIGDVDAYRTLDTRAPVVAEELAAAGYHTSAYNASPTVRADLGLSRGFARWRDGRSDTNLVDLAVAEIATWGGDAKPNFLYVHLMSAHIPLIPSAASAKAVGLTTPFDPKLGFGYDHWAKAPAEQKAKRLDDFRRAYLAGVRDADANVGRLLAAVHAAGLDGDTAIVVTADHGELLGEHDQIGHNGGVWEPLTRVPLIVRAPGVAPRRETKRFGRTIDIAPTLVELAGRARPAAWQGTSLLAAGGPTWAVAERDHLLTVSDGRVKTLEDRAKERFLGSIDLVADPGERTIRKETTLPGVQPLIDAATSFRAVTPKGTNQGQGRARAEEERQAELEALRTLGYVE